MAEENTISQRRLHILKKRRQGNREVFQAAVDIVGDIDEVKEDYSKVQLNVAVGIVVFLNAIMIGLGTEYDDGSLFWVAAENVFLFLFITEAMIRIRMETFKEYIRCGWNWLDILCIVVSIFDIALSTIVSPSSVATYIPNIRRALHNSASICGGYKIYVLDLLAPSDGSLPMCHFSHTGDRPQRCL